MSQRILLIEDTTTLQLIYSTNLRNAGYSVDLASNGAEGIDMFMDNNNPVVIMDLFLPDMDGIDVIRRLVQENPHAKIIVITSNGSVNRAVDAMRAGAFDFLLKPFSDERLFSTVAAAFKSAQSRTDINLQTGNFYGFVGRSSLMQETYRKIMRVAPSNAPVFISGERGTGKGTCARAIHEHSGPKSRPFLQFSGSDLAAEMQDTQLFGGFDTTDPEKETTDKSIFERAFGGVLYISEVGDLDPVLQNKLANVLRKSTQHETAADEEDRDFPRIVCSSKSDPYQLLKSGAIRENLFYQLHILTIEMHPLRELGDDIIYIAQVLLGKLASVEHKDFKNLSSDVETLFRNNAWPGNINQLKNLLHSIVATYDGVTVTREMLPIGFVSASHHAANDLKINEDDDPFYMERRNNAIHQLIGLELEEVERKFIEATIQSNGGSIPRAAEVLGVAPSTIYRKRSKP